MQVVLHEDKKYYPTASETYGPDVEVWFTRTSLMQTGMSVIKLFMLTCFTKIMRLLEESKAFFVVCVGLCHSNFTCSCLAQVKK